MKTTKNRFQCAIGDRFLSKSEPEDIPSVDWYLGSYLSRFIAIGQPKNGDSEAKFTSWENTVLVKAESFEHAFEKVEAIGKDHGEPYTNIHDESVQWEYLGITELVPIFEELEDGVEIRWKSYYPKKLKNLIPHVKTFDDLCK